MSMPDRGFGHRRFLALDLVALAAARLRRRAASLGLVDEPCRQPRLTHSPGKEKQ